MEKKAHLAGILFAVIFGFSFMFSKIVLASDYVSPIGLIAYRFLIAFVVFEVLRLTKSVKIRFEKKNFLVIFLVAIFQPVLYFIFEAYGINLTTSGEAGMMIALIPIFVTILSSFILKEKPLPIQIFFIVLSVSGIILIHAFKNGFKFESDTLGFVYLFFAVLSAALFNIASRNASKKVTSYELTYFMMLSGAVAFNIIYVVQLGLESSLPDYISNFMHEEVIFPILYLGIIASIGGFFLVNYTLSKLPAHVSSIYSNIATIIAVIAGALFLKEQVHYYHIIGAAMIILGVYGTVRYNFIRNRGEKKSND